MNPAKQTYYRTLGESMIKKFATRRIDAFYCETADEAREKALELMPAGSSVTWGGSVTCEEIGLIDAVRAGDYEVIDRATAPKDEDPRIMMSKQMMADYFLMSTNAFTRDGQLVNIDGRGNRLAFLVCGPEHVIVVAGMQKLCRDVPAAIQRVHDLASPPNTMRLGLKTPCAITGQCANCLSEQCICCSEVITRVSRIPHRITVIMVGEEVGY